MRPTLDEYFIQIAYAVATRSTCLRRSVGCVLVDSRHHILATGYNGVAAGVSHCNQADYSVSATTRLIETVYPYACLGARSPSGTDLDCCQAIHAEQNALVQCHDAYAIDTCYSTTEPCVSCTKLLLGTSCHRVVFAEEYPHAAQSRALWFAGRESGTWSQCSRPAENELSRGS